MADEPIPLKSHRRQARRCPVCGRPPWPAERPFCSRRCREVDLARWFAGVYRIGTDESPTEAEDPSGREQG